SADEHPLLVRCNVVERSSELWIGDGLGEITSDDVARYNGAFRTYREDGRIPRIFAVFPPEFYGAGADQRDDPDYASTYIDNFSTRAADMAVAFHDYVTDFIIWNEPNNPGNAQTSLDAANFAALLYACWSKMNDRLGPGNFNVYWGGLDVGTANVEA